MGFLLLLTMFNCILTYIVSKKRKPSVFETKEVNALYGNIQIVGHLKMLEIK